MISAPRSTISTPTTCATHATTNATAAALVQDRRAVRAVGRTNRMACVSRSAVPTTLPCSQRHQPPPTQRHPPPRVRHSLPPPRRSSQPQGTVWRVILCARGVRVRDRRTVCRATPHLPCASRQQTHSHSKCLSSAQMRVHPQGSSSTRWMILMEAAVVRASVCARRATGSALMVFAMAPRLATVRQLHSLKSLLSFVIRFQ